VTLAWTPWLPEDVAVPASAQQALAEQVESWAREWFAGAPACLVGQLNRVAAPRSELRKTVWHGCSDGVAIGLPTLGAAALGGLVLGVSAAAGNRNAEDLKLLDALGKECLDGLKYRLAQLFGLVRPDWRPSDAGWGEAEVFRLEIAIAARAATIQIALSLSRFARFLHGVLPSPEPAAPLGDAAAALARIPIPLSALLGRCSLSLAELSGLAPDDVLVLDSATADPLPLAVDGTPLARGRCTIVEAGKGLALKIVQAPTG
jgi:flagellar motor switch/type III secretory pathway protein FliN